MSAHHRLRLGASAIAIMAAAIAANVHAQAGASSEAQPTGQAPTTVDQIVVTAQKRTESLQNVPIVVTTVGRQLLQDTGVRDIKDLSLLTPGLLVTSTTSEASTTARIRGIGTVGDNPGLESSVGVVIDGVYRSRNGVGFGDLGDVSQIEVLKGPQSTLFGKSTSAGVINILTAAPSFKFGGSAEFTASNYGGYGGSVGGHRPSGRRCSGRQPLFRRSPAGRILHRQRWSRPQHRQPRHQPRLLHRARSASVRTQ